MHELTIVDNLIKFLEKFCDKEKAEKVLCVTLKINPFSCLDRDNINFVFSSLTKENSRFEDTVIEIVREKEFTGREMIIEKVEIEVENESENGGSRSEPV